MELNSNLLSKDIFIKRYLVLKHNLIYYYADKKSYESNSHSYFDIKRRPTDLDGLELTIINNNDSNNKESNGQISLILSPIDVNDDRKNIELRCETITIAIKWIEVLNKVIDLLKNNNCYNKNASLLTNNNINDDNVLTESKIRRLTETQLEVMNPITGMNNSHIESDDMNMTSQGTSASNVIRKHNI